MDVYSPEHPCRTQGDLQDRLGECVRSLIWGRARDDPRKVSQKSVIDMSADRGAFVCQSQSLNIHLTSPTPSQLTSMHFYGVRSPSAPLWRRAHPTAQWKKGLKTGMYYLRTRAAASAIQFTIDKKMQDEVKLANKTAADTKRADKLAAANLAKKAIAARPVLAEVRGISHYVMLEGELRYGTGRRQRSRRVAGIAG